MMYALNNNYMHKVREQNESRISPDLFMFPEFGRKNNKQEQVHNKVKLIINGKKCTCIWPL